MPRQNYASSFDFAKFDIDGIKPIRDAFEQAGLTVTDVEATNRAARRSGFQVKQAAFYFSDSQKVSMLLKNNGDGTGDIYQVTLNGSIVPIKNVSSLDGAAGEIARLLGANSAKFLKAQERKMAAQKVDERDLEGNKKAKTLTATAKIEAAKAEIEQITNDLTTQETRRNELQAQVEQANADLAAKQAELEQLAAENASLEADNG